MGRLRPLGLLVAPLGVAAAVVAHFGALGDYPQDAGPPVSALASGHLLRALRLESLMGSVSIFLRAPFVALAHGLGAGGLGAYRAGALVCLVPVALLGAVLARPASERTGTRGVALLVAVLAVASPPLVAAVRLGHPEEALAAALAVGAVLLTARDRTIPAAILLGLALATKQWTLVAVAPVVIASARPARLRLIGVAAAAAALLTLPAIAADAAGFLHVNHQAATTPRTIGHATVWFLLAKPHLLHLHHVPAGLPTELTVYHVPAWVMTVSHPLIVLVPLPIAVLVARRNAAGARACALPLLALAFLLRCVLDPVDNAYYHLPLFLTLLAYESTRARRLPVVSLLTAGALWLTFDRVEALARPALTNALYLSWTAVLGVYLVHALGLLPRPSVTVRRRAATAV
jgi:hypothetical protein